MLELITTELILAVIGLISVVLSGWLAWSKSQSAKEVQLIKLKNEQISQEMTSQRE